MKYGKVSL